MASKLLPLLAVALLLGRAGAAEAARFKESALLAEVVRLVRSRPGAPAAEVAALANRLLPTEGVNFRVEFEGEALEAALYGDPGLRRRLGEYRIEPLPTQVSTTPCGTAYYLPFVSEPLLAPGLALEGGPAYLKPGALRFDTVALLEKGRARPVRRWALPDEGEVPVGISRDGRTLYFAYRAASAETGWVPVEVGSEGHLVLASGPGGMRFVEDAGELTGQSWDTLAAPPWKVPAPEGRFDAFGVLKAWGRDYHFGFENLCR